MIVAWQWLPFATLIILTSLQSLDEEQIEAAELDGAGAFSTFIYIVLPHLARADRGRGDDRDDLPSDGVRRNLRDDGRRPGLPTTNIAFLIYSQALLGFDVGGASAGGAGRGRDGQHRRSSSCALVGRNLER